MNLQLVFTGNYTDALGQKYYNQMFKSPAYFVKTWSTCIGGCIFSGEIRMERCLHGKVVTIGSSNPQPSAGYIQELCEKHLGGI